MIGGLIGGLAGAGASIAGALIQAEEQEQTRQMNWAVAIMNFQQRERERNEAISMALKQQREQKLGYTDIRGTRTKFVPGKGWVVTAGPGIAEMQALQDKEQRKVLEHDLPQRRKVADRNYSRGLLDEAIAEGLRQQFRNVRRGSDDAIAADLYEAQAMGLREAGRDASRRVFTQMLRTRDNSNIRNVAGRMAEANNSAYMKAALQARMAARGQSAKEYDDRRKGIANLYSMFASRAGQLPEVNYKPQQLDAQANLDMAGKLAAGAAGDVAKYSAMKGGELDYLQPNMALGNGIAAAGNQLASAFKGLDFKSGGVGGFGATGGGSSGGGGMDDYFTDNETSIG